MTQSLKKVLALTTFSTQSTTASEMWVSLALAASLGFAVASEWQCNCTHDGSGCYINQTITFTPGSQAPASSNLGPLPADFGGDLTISAFVFTQPGERTANWARVVDLGGDVGASGHPADNILFAHNAKSGRLAYQVYFEKQEAVPIVTSRDLVSANFYQHYALSRPSFLHVSSCSKWPTRIANTNDNLTYSDVDGVGFLAGGLCCPHPHQPDDGSSALPLTRAQIPEGVWVHVVAVQSGETVSIYWDDLTQPGGLELQATGAVNVARMVPRIANKIGVSNWPSDAVFAGKVRGVRIYNRALDSSELHALLAVGSGPSRGLVDLCMPGPAPAPPKPVPPLPPSPPAPPPPDPPPSPPSSAAFALDVTSTGPVISPLLYGHDLEFTRHDLYEGLSAEVLANRKFALPTEPQPNQPAGIVPRWIAIGEPTLDLPFWSNNSHLVTGDSGHSIHCLAAGAGAGAAVGTAAASAAADGGVGLRATSTAVAPTSLGAAVGAAAGRQCGVWQGQNFDGFNSLRSHGNAIWVQRDKQYRFRTVTKGTAAVTVALTVGLCYEFDPLFPVF
jgi:hypothetical protein